MTATLSPYLEQKMLTVCGVSDISGTSIMTDFPSDKVRSIAFIITFVLPEPVIPYRSAALGSFSEYSESIAEYAALCARLRTISDVSLFSAYLE